MVWSGTKLEDSESQSVQLRVAGVKMVVTKNVETNRLAIQEAIDFASSENADILLTPEGSLSGYTADFDLDAVEDALARVVEYARAAELGLALGTCFQEKDGRRYNQVRFYDKSGRFLGFHSKILRCGDHQDPKAGEIAYYSATPLRTFQFEDLTIGGLICNDLWANPGCTTLPDTHLTQQLSEMGARIIFHAVNGGRDASAWSEVNWNFHDSNLRMRARSGKVFIVSADNAHPVNLKSSAPSGVVDPTGQWICTTEDRGIQHFVHTIRLDETSQR
jgi:predicted amidohydrolase